MRVCSVCKKKYCTGNPTPLFKTPRDEATRKRWGEICGRVFKSYSVVCAEHFDPGSIVNVGRKMTLLLNAEPMANRCPVAEMHAEKAPTELPIYSNQSNVGQGSSNTKQNWAGTEPLHDRSIALFSWEELTGAARQVRQFAKEEGIQMQKNINNFDELISCEDLQNDDVENSEEVFTPNLMDLSNDVIPPQLQEEPIIMHMPIIKSVSCAGTTQTNTRFCGLVQTSGYLDEFRLNCFYCPEVFPLEKWTSFVKHLKEEHYEREEAFKMIEYVSADHDYTPINLPSSADSALEKVVVKDEPSDLLEDPLKPTLQPLQTVILNSQFHYALDEGKSVCSNLDISNNFIDTYSSAIASPGSEMSNNNYNYHNGSYFGPLCNNSEMDSFSKSAELATSETTEQKLDLSRCPKTANDMELMNPEEKAECISTYIEIAKLKPTEIAFEYTPRDIVDLLLDSMKNYDVLWQFDSERFNEDFYDAVEELCKIINDKFSLNIDNLRMRRSINRILRFYCYLYPNVNVENIDQFTNYYDKCAAFLPACVNEIAYARCSHCYICYKHDFDLKRHLLEEQKYLQWPYKCILCKECFRENDEFEFHKQLPHYNEIFRCLKCNKSFLHRNKYNRHISNYHPTERPAEFICDLCGKALQSKSGLINHKKTSHGERKHKCHVCQKSFFTITPLNIHMRIHRQEFNFVCEVCGKAFIFASGLRQHMKMHTGAKVHCPICNFKLRKSSLSRHLRLLHASNRVYAKRGRKTSNSYGRGDYRRLIKKSWSARKKECEKRKYLCKICKVNFDTYKSRIEHNKEFHSDIPRRPCKLCNVEFSLNVNLKRHYRKKHNLHVIQAYKLVNENWDINEVLNMKPEFLDELAEMDTNSKTPTKFDLLPNEEEEANSKTPTKSDLLPDEIFFETERLDNSMIQDEIIEAADEDGVIQEFKIDYIHDLFTEI